MGIFPYQSPEEQKAMRDRLNHYKKFVETNGYKCCYTLNPANPSYYLPRKGFTAPNGEYYETAEEMRAGYGMYPSLEKDGICYNYYEPAKIHGYVEQFQDEVAFLESNGYKRIWPKLDEDYIKNNDALEEFYKRFGFVPRWEHDKRWFGHTDLLEDLGYKYNEWK